ncbi:universal stress protein [Candidatus Binatia bacterium]|nr:universal stress protein [Candidatus Binatia bacterium]
MPREFKTTLCPTDFSSESFRALAYGLRFAQQAGGKLLLLHVVHVPSGELYEPSGHVLTFEEARTRALARMLDIHRDQLGNYANCELLTEVGDPAEQTALMARQRDVDLIVLSTHGHTSMDHILVGSVAEAIVRTAPCPVFVVRRGAE